MVVPAPLLKERRSGMKETRMTPPEYCEKWIPVLYGFEPGEYGYRKACIQELMYVTSFEPGTIKNWGADLNTLSKRSRPMVERLLALQDLANETDRLIRPFVFRPHIR